ncbi:MFS general substrate transporter [Crepidotus variabilis]|uniref:MFS general substrate transporter n=1 Tax=Crepidotus variabilis TaxID=179855 RepID=A0A9P6E5U3_9AGAR|nr:MFS general substrate transporter [Crepidotus variabilis]
MASINTRTSIAGSRHDGRSNDHIDKLEKNVQTSSEEAKTNLEGTNHQLALGLKPKRRGFFRLDKEYANAVRLDAEEVDYSEAEERKVCRKIDLTVLPLIICSYVFSQFDRVNSGNAHLIDDFNKNFGITNNQKWLLALSIFYVGYGLLEMPANVLLRNIGAKRFFFISLVFWGLSSLSVVYAKGYGGLIILRVFLGIGEAGFHAGMIFYLSFWYRRHEIAMRIGMVLNGTVPGAIGGVLAFGLVRAHTKDFVGWQSLFLIESIPTIFMGFMILFFLPDFPFSATFLNPRERAIAQARLNRDQRPQPHGGISGWEGFKAVVKDLNSWMFMITHASFNIGVSTISYFLPTIIKELGFSSLHAQGLSATPHLAGYVMVLFQAWHSDRTRERGWHVMASSASAVVGYVILATCSQKSVGASFFALFLVVGGNFSLFPLVLGWATNALAPTSKRGVGLAFIISISNCILVASPEIYFDPGDRYRKAHAICAGLLFLTFCMAFLLKLRLRSLNKRNKMRLEALPTMKNEALGKEIWDTDPRYVFMT